MSEKLQEDMQKAYYNNWQRIVNIIAGLLNTPVALISKVDDSYIEIIKTNEARSNPLNEGEVFKLADHYCEKVIKNRKMLLIENASKDEDWKHSPEQEYGLISYLGFPIVKPDGEIYGTICVLDTNERHFTKLQRDLLFEFKKVIENHLVSTALNNKCVKSLNHITKLKEKYKTLFNNINDALFLHKYDDNGNIKIGKFIEVNKEACKRLGYSREELLEISPEEIDSPKFRDSNDKRKVIKKLKEDGEITFEAEHISKQGQIIPVEINSTIIEYNKQKMILSIARDITRRKKIEKKLETQNKLVQSSLDSLSANIAILDKAGFIRYTNKVWDEFAQDNGLSPEKCGTGINYLNVCQKAEGKGAEGAMEAYHGIQDVINGNKELFKMEYPCHAPEAKRWFQMRVTPFTGEGPCAAVVTHVNITEIKLKEEEAKYYSLHDQMTGLYNRRYFEEELERLNKSRRLPISVVVGDLDNLKELNDSYGHKTGDEIIKKAGKVIANNTRDDDIVARIGGDEFAIILPEVGSNEVLKLIKRIKNACRKCKSKGEIERPLEISLGYATMFEKEENLNKIFDQADKNMYKNKGRIRKKLC